MNYAKARAAVREANPRSLRRHARFFAVMAWIGLLPPLVFLVGGLAGAVLVKWPMVFLVLVSVLALQYPAFMWATRNRYLRRIETREQLLSRDSGTTS